MCFCIFVCVFVLMTAHPPDGSCDVQAFNCISNGLIGVCGCVFFFFFFEHTNLNKVRITQSIKKRNFKGYMLE